MLLKGTNCFQKKKGPLKILLLDYYIIHFVNFNFEKCVNINCMCKYV